MTIVYVLIAVAVLAVVLLVRVFGSLPSSSEVWCSASGSSARRSADLGWP